MTYFNRKTMSKSKAIYKRKIYKDMFFANKAAANRRDSRKGFRCQRRLHKGQVMVSRSVV